MSPEVSQKAPVLQVHIRAPGVEEHVRVPVREQVSMGRDSDCDIVLPSPAVSRKHASLRVSDGALIVRDHSSNGTTVAGERLLLGTRRVGPCVELEIGPYAVSVQLAVSKKDVAEPSSVRDERPLATPSVASDIAPCTSVTSAQRRRIRAALLESLDLHALDRAQMTVDHLAPRVRAALERITAEMDAELPKGTERELLIQELSDEALGLGPLEPLLKDPTVSEIMVVDPSTIYVERSGRIELSARTFTDQIATRAVLERIVTPVGRRIDESNPIVDARLLDGSRVNAVIPPLALKGPCITIRKFPKHRLTLQALVDVGSLSEQMARFLERAVRVRVNIVIAGGTGSGKTTLLNVLSAAIPEQERVVTVEDAAELQLAQRHVVSLESRPANMESAGAVTIRDLVKNALRMRPDRIVVGECRGGEALDMLQAMNTGHDGSMTTTHANSPVEAVQRLETLCLMAGLDLPLAAVRRQLSSSVNLFVQQARFADGSRRITHVTEVCGVSQRGEVELRDIFRFADERTDSQGRVHGAFVPTGYIPSFVDRFLANGLTEDGACL